MEILTTDVNPVAPHLALQTGITANRNGAPMISPLARLHDILSESNSAADPVIFIPLRKRAVGRA